jgi:DNA ligase-1
MLTKFYTVLTDAAATASKTAKVDIIRAALTAEPGLARLFELALSPFITFGVAKLPRDHMASDRDRYLILTWLDLLNMLASRELSGNNALAHIAHIRRNLVINSPQALEAFDRILLKDLKAGFGAETVNKARPGTVPTTPYMRCCLPKDAKMAGWDWAKGVFSQEKADGMFANANITADEATLVSRQGSIFPMGPFAELAAEMTRCLTPDWQYHGELLVERDGAVLPREIGNGILNSILKGGEFGAGERPVYLMWDCIPTVFAVAKGRCLKPYFTRYYDLQGSGWLTSDMIRVIPTRIIHSITEAEAHYRELLAQGKEGTVLKHPHAVWKDGTSKHQVKLKLDVDVDLEVIGFTQGKGKFAETFGAVQCATRCRGLRVDVSGFTDQRRNEINASRSTVLGQIMTVKANAVMAGEPHSLFLPRFVELRLDKTVADSLDEVKAQFAAAVSA